MFYAISDIHGCYSKFVRMLDKIGFSNERDILFVLGDVVDRGPNGIKVLQLMMENDHMVPIMGNHDLMAYEILRQLEEKIVQESEKVSLRHILAIQGICRYWFSQGGVPTFLGYIRLKKKQRRDLLDYLGDFITYFEINTGGNSFVLSHGGIREFVENKSLGEYSRADFIYDRPDYTKVYFKDRYLVTGHTPTDLIKGNSGGIYKANNHIAIDCGAVFGNKLGCICLDTLEEFYI